MSQTPKRVRVHHLREAKERGERLTMLTAYDAVTAHIFDDAGIDMLLVGDSIGNTMHGHTTTLPVTVDDMIPPARARRPGRPACVRRRGPAVRLVRGRPRAGARHGRADDEGDRRRRGQVRGRQAGGPADPGAHRRGHPRRRAPGVHARSRRTCSVGRACRAAATTPPRCCARTRVAVAAAGAVAVVLEMVPAPVAARITEIVAIPTIGIGAGAGCDGQVLVWVDMAGMTDWSPRFAKRFGEVGAALSAAAHRVRGRGPQRHVPGRRAPVRRMTARRAVLGAGIVVGASWWAWRCPSRPASYPVAQIVSFRRDPRARGARRGDRAGRAAPDASRAAAPRRRVRRRSRWRRAPSSPGGACRTGRGDAAGS